MPRSSYSDSFKAEALALLDANDGNVKQTASDLEIPRTTLAGWARGRGTHDEVTELRHEKKRDLAAALELRVWRLVPLLDSSDKHKRANLSQVTTAVGTLIDKMRLLRGESTAIEEQHTYQVTIPGVTDKPLHTNGQNGTHGA